MNDKKWLAEQFEAERARLRGVAYRMLGSLAEAEDAVQDAWLKLARADASEVGNLAGWLTTVVARVCLDRLRSRKARREESLDAGGRDGTAADGAVAGGSASRPAAGAPAPSDPESEALLAESVGLAMLVVLDALPPAERVAFVLHDMFDLPFDQIAPMLERTPEAARQLASRARRRVRGGEAALSKDYSAQREVVEGYLAAVRAGDLQTLVSLLAPDVVFRVDAALARPGAPAETRGAEAVARQAIGPRPGEGRARFAQPALVDGMVGVVVAPGGKLRLVLRFTVENGKATAIEAIADPTRLARMEVAVLG